MDGGSAENAGAIFLRVRFCVIRNPIVKIALALYGQAARVISIG